MASDLVTQAITFLSAPYFSFMKDTEKSYYAVFIYSLQKGVAFFSYLALLLFLVCFTICLLFSIYFTVYGVYKDEDGVQHCGSANKQNLMERLGLTDENAPTLTQYEQYVACDVVDQMTVEFTWEDIGGLEEEISELRSTVIMPLKNSDLFQKSPLFRAPMGVLLHGPPGCGKTSIAKAMAKDAGARFINLDMSSLFDKWFGESEKRAKAFFTLARKIQPTIMFIDEIDTLLRGRSNEDHETSARIKAQFLSLWDGFNTDKGAKVLIVGATNRYEDIDAAILRRLPTKIYVGMPSAQQRQHILQVTLREANTGPIDYMQLGQLTDGFSGSDLQDLCRRAVISTLVILNNSSSLRSLQQDDLHNAFWKMRNKKGHDVAASMYC